MSKLGSVDIFKLTPSVLQQRWASLILAFAYACSSMKVPTEWIGPELAPRPTEVKFATYHHRLHKTVARWPEDKLRQHILGVLKVCDTRASSCLNTIYISYFEIQICVNVIHLQTGQQVDTSPNLSAVLSVVSPDLLAPGARKRLVMRVEPGSMLARPKLVGFEDTNDDSISWAVYINKQVCMHTPQPTYCCCCMLLLLLWYVVVAFTCISYYIYAGVDGRPVSVDEVVCCCAPPPRNCAHARYILD